MELHVLPLHLYVEKFIEPVRPGFQYEADARQVYRVANGAGEDIAVLPAELCATELPALSFAGGTYVSDPATASRLVTLSRRLQSLLRELNEVLRS